MEIFDQLRTRRTYTLSENQLKMNEKTKKKLEKNKNYIQKYLKHKKKSQILVPITSINYDIEGVNLDLL